MFTYENLLDLLDGFNPAQLDKEVNIQIKGLDIPVQGVFDGRKSVNLEYPVLLLIPPEN